MGELKEQLLLQRNQLNEQIDRGIAHVQGHWTKVEPLMNSWWTAFKNWEKSDTFDKAFNGSRMTVRTFPGGVGAFEKQVSKQFKTISVADSDRTKTEVRIFADNQYTKLAAEEMKPHDDKFHKSADSKNYHAVRGINSSAFADPSNFVSREKKYEEGLHDLSASLLNPNLSIFNQIHNSDEGTGKLNFEKKEIEGAHFSFLPLSKEDDQLMLYKLIQCAKGLRLMLPALYDKVRNYRAEMTRVKLAYEMDMGIGYSAVPVAEPRGGPAYKLRYAFGFTTSVTGQGQVPITPQIAAARQQAALRFKSIIGVREGKNEIVIAIRKHAGSFPVYAVRTRGELVCYDIVEGAKVLNGKRISSAGVMTG